MRLIHNSRLSQLRSPFGAVEKGTDVTLSVLVEDAEPRTISIDLRVWIDGKGETIIPLRYEADGIFTVTLPCPEPALMWYRFNVTATFEDSTRTLYLGGSHGGRGRHVHLP